MSRILEVDLRCCDADDFTLSLLIDRGIFVLIAVDLVWRRLHRWLVEALLHIKGDIEAILAPDGVILIMGRLSYVLNTRQVLANFIIYQCHLLMLIVLVLWQHINYCRDLFRVFLSFFCFWILEFLFVRIVVIFNLPFV